MSHPNEKYFVNIWSVKAGLVLYLVDTKPLMVISYSAHCTYMALELGWIISVSISGIVAIVGIIFIANILVKRSDRKQRKANLSLH